MFAGMNITSNITTNTNNISTNTNNISTNTSNITTNTNNISTNTNNISTNTSNITTNTNNISTNTNNISTNTSNITTNTNNISTNTSNITTNTNNISTNTSNITTNTNNISTNTSSITTNANSISTNTSNITSLQNSKQDNLTFGIANGNTVTMGETANQSEYAKFNSNGLKGMTVSEVKVDLNLNNVTNESKSTMFANPNFTGIPTAPTADVDITDQQIATTAYVKNKIDELIDGAPDALNTLYELAAAIGDDNNYAAGVTNTITNLSNRIDLSLNKVDLSLNDLSQNYYNNIVLKAPINNPSFTGNVTVATTSVSDSNLTVKSNNRAISITDKLDTNWSEIRSHNDGFIDNKAYLQITSYGLKLETEDGLAMYLDPSKNVGIGTTTPDSKLEVAGDISCNNLNVSEIKLLHTNGDGLTISGRNEINSVSGLFLQYQTSENLLLCNGGGNVGIGTTSPTDKLEIRDIHSQLRLTDSEDNKYVQFSFSSEMLAIRINSNSSEDFFIKEGGDVGIGTITPQTKLHVKGDIKVTGTNAGISFRNGPAYNGRNQNSSIYSDNNEDRLNYNGYAGHVFRIDAAANGSVMEAFENRKNTRISGT